jgi:hypothetical protein
MNYELILVLEWPAIPEYINSFKELYKLHLKNFISA